MAKIDNSAARVYSTDKNLWLGMTRENAYKAGEKVLKLFNYADKDGDKILSQKELNRYNSPVVIENYEEVSNSRVVTQGKVSFNNLFVGNGNVSLKSQIVTNKEEEFYAGLKLSEVSTKGSEIFYAMDLNHDGSLSKGEMKIAAEIKARTNKAIKQVKDSFENNSRNSFRSVKWGVGGGAALGAVATGGSILMACEDGAIIGALGGGVIGAILGFTVGAAVGTGIAYFGGKSIGKNANFEKIFKEAMGSLATYSYAKYAKETFMKAANALAKEYFE